MYFVLFGIGCAILLWISHQRNSSNFIKLAKQLPSNKLHTWLGFGPIPNFKDCVKYFYKYGKTYGSDSIMWFGTVPVFLTFEPKTIKDIFTSKNCINKPNLIYGLFAKSMGQGLITNNEPFWSQHRKILNPAFANKNLLAFLPIFNKEADYMIQQIDYDHKSNRNDMLVTFRMLTVNIASQTVLKRNFSLTSYDIKDFVKRFYELLDFLMQICLSVKFRIKIVRKLSQRLLFKEAALGRKDFHEFICESINLAREHNTSDPSYIPNINGIVDYALKGVDQNKSELSEVEGQMVQLFAGAFETTSGTLFLIVALLAMHKEYQELLYEEISSIMSESQNNEVKIEDIEKMVYLDMIINETMRLFPPVPQVFRRISGDNITLSNGATLPSGQIIVIDIYHLHRDKQLWGTDADVFNPDNFLPENVQSRHPYSFIPFTKGLRFCIGWRYALLSIKVNIAKLIMAYTFSTDFKYENLAVENHVTIKLVEEPVVFVNKRIIEQ